MDALVGCVILFAVFGVGVLVARGLRQGLREEGSSESDDAASGLSSQDWLLYQMMSDPQTQTSSSPNPCDMSLSSGPSEYGSTCTSPSDATSCGCAADNASPTCDPGCCDSGQSSGDATN